jgi:hypothetical protein
MKEPHPIAEVIKNLPELLENVAFKSALVKEGWLPPPEKALQIDIERYAQRCHKALTGVH